MTDKRAAEEYQAICQTPLGWLRVTTTEEAVIRVEMLEDQPHVSSIRPLPIARTACEQLQYWLNGGEWPRFSRLEPGGTPFQQRVWKALLQIPPGEVRTYGELARQLNTSPRAVGGACRSNPIPLFIPCHRVVAANGDGGFAGHTKGLWMDRKRWLLRHEG